MHVGPQGRKEWQERTLMSSDESREPRCSAPPALSGLALLAAADGEADDATIEHLRACPHCAAQFEQVRRLQARLLRRLYRLHCPRSDLLVDYCQGLLDPFQRTAITHHLAVCPHCTHEVALLERSAPMVEVVGYGAFGRATVLLP
jgi:anti-sigma factor RsiW